MTDTKQPMPIGDLTTDLTEADTREMIIWFMKFLAAKEIAGSLYDEANTQYVAQHGAWTGEVPRRVLDTVAALGSRHPEAPLLRAYWAASHIYADPASSSTPARTESPEPPESIDDLDGRFKLVEMGVRTAVDGVLDLRDDDDATSPLRNHLSPVPDPASEPGRTVTHAQMVEALTVLGLSTRYVQALGLRDDGIWVHSIMPGKSGGRLVGHTGSWIDRRYVEYIKVTDVPEDDL